ncbi:hypothetical protein [Nocardia mangyaensis]|uniref:hypothetical protein n=1 Tax=Nocardia mangyaensis TaxID=2213200 RepID=UPI002675939C|nr:hypothetical protein [Nocardia mangyaensis]MDO3651281.1 hypothetical protein [Nocardia mangyaensis]
MKKIFLSIIGLSFLLVMPVYADTFYTDIGENAGLENWEGTPILPEDWDSGDGTGGTITEETDLCDDEPCARFSSTGADPHLGLVQTISCTEGDIVYVSFDQYDLQQHDVQWALYAYDAVADLQWLYGQGIWDTDSDFGTWDYFFGTSPSSWGTYDQYGESDLAVCPSSEEITFILSPQWDSAVDGYYTFIDNIYFQTSYEYIPYATTTPLLTYFVDEYFRPIALIGGSFLFLSFFYALWQLVYALKKWYASF